MPSILARFAARNSYPKSLQEMGMTLEQFDSMVKSSVPDRGIGVNLKKLLTSVVFLCSDAALPITGQSFAIDSGLIAELIQRRILCQLLS